MASLRRDARDWRLHATASVAIAVVCLCAIAPALASAQSDQPRAQAAETHQGNSQASNPALPPPTISIVNSPAYPLSPAAAERPSSHSEPHQAFWLEWEFWTAIGTIGLAITTLALVWKTDGLIRSAERSSERQLRAYIAPAEHVFIEQDMANGVRFESRALIKNFGQTPAYDVVAITMFDFIAPSVIPNFDFTVKKPETESSTALGPTQTKFYSNIFNRMLTPTELTDLPTANGPKFFLWGTVWYRDAFGEDRHTNFAYQVVWSGPGIPFIWRDIIRHNDAH